MPMKGTPSISPTSTRRSTPCTATRVAPAGSSGSPSTRAKSFPPPPGRIASALLELADLGAGDDLLAEQPLRVRLLQVVGIEDEEDVLLHGVPGLVRELLRRYEQLAGPRQPVQLEDPEPVGVQALAVREEEVEAGERGAVDDRGHGAPQRAERVAGVVIAHQEVEERLRICLPARLGDALLDQPRIVQDRAVVG